VRNKDEGPELIESWEGKFLWGAYNRSVKQESTEEHVSEGKRGLKVHFDLARFPRPMLYAPLAPLWDLGGVASLDLDVYVPPETAEGLQISLALVYRDKRHRSTPVGLRRGWNKVSVPLGGGWLPRQARAAVEQVEWELSGTTRKLRGWVVLDNFRAGPAAGE